MSKPKKSIIDTTWEALFEKYSILKHINANGVFNISSSQINEFHQARLMAKFDYQEKMPQIFLDNGLAILPMSNRTYVIGRFNIFEKIKHNKLETKDAKKLPSYITAIDIEHISSETTALLCANICGILNSFFEEDEITHVIGGRMGSGDFNFKLSDINFSVSKSQIEIDGGFESENYIYLVEVKNLIHDNFLVRQIYYPYRTWTKKLEEKCINKEVRNIFLTYSDGNFYLREYEFEQLEDPSSIRMVKEDRYSIVKDALNFEKLQEIINTVAIVEEPELPFPQCNDLDKVINLCELLCYRNEAMSKPAIAEEFHFVVRQADYYGNGGRYLNLITSNPDKSYSLTQLGESIFSQSLQQRQIELVRIILSHKPFNIIMRDYIEQGDYPSHERVEELLKDYNMYKVNKQKITFKRRCSTVKGWINWIFDRVEA
ncbi:hypothetical protein [Psychrobacter sp.]|uniref:type II restriction enzyme n=1 Tax=Psychrobacter sp. TaxID=56811 RepID=UPI0025F28F1D|nr:hypothetical protein [Psychrobacter sp.]